MSVKLIIIISFLTVLNWASLNGSSLPSPNLTEDARITMLTCSPGDELYSVFGHSAIRVQDEELNLDWVFNYGTFDFADPNFYLNFVKGRLNYVLSVVDYPYFEFEYKAEGRWIWEQELNIDHREKQELFDSLVINYNVPEYRYYLYDFFFDNCATRIRDIFTEAIDRDIEFDYSTLEKGQSFRDLIQPYLKEKPWTKLGINLVLGRPADRTAEPWEYMFLPDHMMEAFEHASFVDNNETIPFTPGSNIILEGSEESNNILGIPPLIILALILASGVVFSYLDIRKKKHTRWFDIAILGIAGLLGLLFLFMWAFSDHHVTNWNFNLLWAHPLHLVMVFLLLARKRLVNVKRYYFMAISLLTLLVLLLWPVFPQDLPAIIIPFLLAIIVRSVTIFLNLREVSISS